MSKEDVDRIMVELYRVTDEMMIDLAFAIHGILVRNPPTGTPVDTGYASAKWWFSVGRLPARTVDDLDVSGAAQQQTMSVIDASNYKMTEGSMFVYNDTRYIEYLNKGSSKQSPAFFVENAVDKAIGEVYTKYLGTITI